MDISRSVGGCLLGHFASVLPFQLNNTGIWRRSGLQDIAFVGVVVPIVPPRLQDSMWQHQAAETRFTGASYFHRAVLRRSAGVAEYAS